MRNGATGRMVKDSCGDLPKSLQRKRFKVLCRDPFHDEYERIAYRVRFLHWKDKTTVLWDDEMEPV